MLYFKDLDHSWVNILHNSISAVDKNYLQLLMESDGWLPGHDKIFNAFRRPLKETKYILFGESPYPRHESANGFAFWDAKVDSIWSNTGLSTQVNRATSLRNFIKMLLIAEGYLKPEDTSQQAIAQLDKRNLISKLDELFNKLLDKGFLLLNASLVLSELPVAKEARIWEPFMNNLLEQIHHHNASVELILWGNIAKRINRLQHACKYRQMKAEHPYNISFITNKEMIEFFSPMRLLTNL